MRVTSSCRQGQQPRWVAAMGKLPGSQRNHSIYLYYIYIYLNCLAKCSTAWRSMAQHGSAWRSMKCFFSPQCWLHTQHDAALRSRPSARHGFAERSAWPCSLGPGRQPPLCGTGTQDCGADPGQHDGCVPGGFTSAVGITNHKLVEGCSWGVGIYGGGIAE